MSRLRIALLSLVAVCAASMLVTAVASAEGPFWYVNGTKLTQGSKGIKLQNKGTLVLKSTFMTLGVTITCTNATSNGTIDGFGTHQGQAKGTITYTQCKGDLKNGEKCTVTEPIKTNQIKSHLVREVFHGVEQNGELFEPSPSQQTAKPFFVKVILGSTCGLASGAHEIKGSVVGDIEPSEEELVEGTLHFPEPSEITEVIHEGQKITPRLTFGNETATFEGQFGARLQSGEKFGVKLT